MGPYVFLKKVTFRVQTAPFDKIRIEFWRSRRRLDVADLILAKNPNIGEARSKGLMGALEAVKDKDSKTPFGPEANVSEKIANACSDLGLICRPLGQAIVLCPAFILTGSQMDEMFEKLTSALNKVFSEVS